MDNWPSKDRVERAGLCMPCSCLPAKPSGKSDRKVERKKKKKKEGRKEARSRNVMGVPPCGGNYQTCAITFSKQR